MRIEIIIFIILTCNLVAQDVTSFKERTPVKFTGGLSAGTSYINNGNARALDDQLGYNFTVNGSASVYGLWSFPFSFSYSQNQRSFSRPQFSRFGISPSYKWIKVHLGHRAYRTSTYLSGGINLLGGGIELTPGKFNFSFFYGKARNEYNRSVDILSYDPGDFNLYNRNMMGLSVSYGDYSNKLGIHLFRAQDDSNSGSIDSLYVRGIHPKENLGVGVNARFSFFRIAFVEVNGAASAITSNQFSPEIDAEDDIAEIISRLDRAITVNKSSRYHLAYDGKFGFRWPTFTIAYQYQHVDPFYNSLGVSFIQQDLDNHNIVISTSLFKSRLNLQGSIGIQRNNTQSYQASANERTIANVGLQWRLSKSFNISGNYNNFNSSSVASVQEVLDTLAVITNSTGLNGNINYNQKKESYTNKIKLSLSNNTYSLVQLDTIGAENSQINASLSLSRNYKESGWNLGFQFNAAEFTNPASRHVRRYGGGLTIGKKVSKKINIIVRPNYNLNFSDGEKDGYVINTSAQISGKITKKITLGLSGNYVKRETTRIRGLNQYRFSLRIRQKF